MFYLPLGSSECSPGSRQEQVEQLSSNCYHLETFSISEINIYCYGTY